MVSVNVSQLLLAGAGVVREFDFGESFPDPTGDLHLSGPIRGHARLLRTSEGILVNSEYKVAVTLECARCLDESRVQVSGRFEEEFLPSTDIRTGVPAAVVPAQDDQPLIDEHHVIDLDEVLRQNILTQLPLRPLCSATCPGLCTTCGQRLAPNHPQHFDIPPPEAAPVDPANPFARLAVLLTDDQER